MFLKGHCENFIGMPLEFSQEGNLKSDRLEHSISVHGLARRHMALYDVKIYHDSLASCWTLLTL